MVFGENAVARTRISQCSTHRYHGGTFVWDWATEIRTQDEHYATAWVKAMCVRTASPPPNIW